jgi:hypothetical protein
MPFGLGHSFYFEHFRYGIQALYLYPFEVQLKKLRGLSPQANYTEQPPHVGEVSANFCG